MIKMELNRATHYLFVIIVSLMLGAYYYVVQEETAQLSWTAATRFILLWFSIISLTPLFFSVFIKICAFYLRLEKYEIEREKLSESELRRVMETDIHLFPGIIGIASLIGGARLISISEITSGGYTTFLWGAVLILSGLALPKISIMIPAMENN